VPTTASILNLSTLEAAPALLGQALIFESIAGPIGGIIVETGRLIWA